MYRCTKAAALLPADFLLNGFATWREPHRWPAAHLLRFVFDRCQTYEEAVEMLSEAPLARPALFSIAGATVGEGCLIERTETAAHRHRGPCCIANGWHPAGPARAGRWIPRGTLLRGLADSENRRMLLERHACEAPFAWLVQPVMNGLTRLAVEGGSDRRVASDRVRADLPAPDGGGAGNAGVRGANRITRPAAPPSRAARSVTSAASSGGT
jgi:hypothetical protein